MAAYRMIRMTSAAWLMLIPAIWLAGPAGCQGQWPGMTTQPPTDQPTDQTVPPPPASNPAAETQAKLAKDDATYKYEPARRHNNPIYGFSFCSPDDMERIAIPAGKSGTIAYWKYQYPMAPSNSVILSVHQAISPQAIDLDLFAKDLPEDLKKKSQFEVDSKRIDKVCGKPVIYLSGRITGAFQHQAWVLAEPDTFLIINVTGTETFKNRTERGFQGVMNSLQISDPGPAIMAMNANLERGAALLATIKADRVAAALPPEPEWFIIRRDGKDVGLMFRQFLMAKYMNTNGFNAKVFASVRQNDRNRLMKMQDTFATPSGLNEKWVENQRFLEGSKEEFAFTNYVLDRNFIMFHYEGCRQTINRSFDFPKVVSDPATMPAGNNKKVRPQAKRLGDVYLPRATAALLPMLLDLKKNASYSFAMYSGRINELEMYTLTVAGQQNLTIDGKDTPAFKLTVKETEDADADTMWVDPAGRLLRIEDAAGFVYEKSSQKAVLNIFPTAMTDMARTADPAASQAKPEAPRYR